MQVDLFKSRRRRDEMGKMGNYVKIRHFNLDASTDFDQIRNRTNCTNHDVVEAYIADIKKRINAGRKYEEIGFDLCADNLFDIEALGIGQYAMKYQNIISFEDHLDFILHVVSGCDPDRVRSIPNYHAISKSIMSLKPLEGEDSIKLNSLFEVDPKLDEFFLNKQKVVHDKRQYYGDAFIEQLAFEIIRPILKEVHGIQNYLIAYFSAARSEFGKTACRSRDYSSLIFSADIPALDTLTLNYEPYGSVVLTPKCYEKYEYALKEVLICDNCRRC